LKNVVFTAEQLNNLSEIANELFYDENDPRSPTYERVLNRPKINWLRVILFLLIPFLFLISLILVLKYFDIKPLYIVLFLLIFLVLYAIITLKTAIIGAIKIYQRYAPDSIRNKCRFEPSCSEYMILSIEKYGTIRGVLKGINRLKRCNVNNGGFDYP